MAEADALFEAFGFEKLENGLWRYAECFKGHQEVVGEHKHEPALLIVAEDGKGGFVGHVPFVGQRSDIAGIPDESLFFASDDPRDMVALAQNEKASAYCSSTGDFLDEGFEDDDKDLFVTMPFMSDPWFDYAFVEGSTQGEKHAELLDPAKAYEGYTAWRDEFCGRLAAAVNAAP